MKNLIFAVTYSEITPESAEHGDFSDTGFEHESIEFDSCSELIDYLKNNGFNYPSSPIGSFTRHCWLSTEFEIQSYETVETRQLSIHPSDDASARNLTRACRLAEII